MSTKKKKARIPPSVVSKSGQTSTQTTEEQKRAQSSGITTQETGKCGEKKEDEG